MKKKIRRERLEQRKADIEKKTMKKQATPNNKTRKITANKRKTKKKKEE